MPQIASTAEEAWSQLSLYLSRDFLERRYQRRHGGELGGAKAREIIAHFEQGQQYFRSALSAGSLAGPLEQYYGILAIARAMVLYLSPAAREATLTKGHGLGASLPENGSIEDIRLVVENGTFREFVDATRNVEQVTIGVPRGPRYTPERLPVIRSLPAPEAEETFSLLDVIARIPGVRRQFEDAFGTAACCFSCGTWWFMNVLNISIRYDRADLPEPDKLAALLRMHPRAERQGSEAGNLHFVIPIAEGETVGLLLPHVVDSFDSDDQTVIAPYPGGWVLSELATYFAAAHALSMLVRYYPTRWARLLGHEKGDRSLPVLERLRSLIQTDFIKLVVWELGRPAHQGEMMVWPGRADLPSPTESA